MRTYAVLYVQSWTRANNEGVGRDGKRLDRAIVCTSNTRTKEQAINEINRKQNYRQDWYGRDVRRNGTFVLRCVVPSNEAVPE